MYGQEKGKMGQIDLPLLIIFSMYIFDTKNYVKELVLKHTKKITTLTLKPIT